MTTLEPLSGQGYDEAQATFAEPLASECATGDREGQAACLAALGRVAGALGDFAAAQEGKC